MRVHIQNVSYCMLKQSKNVYFCMLRLAKQNKNTQLDICESDILMFSRMSVKETLMCLNELLTCGLLDVATIAL